MSERSSTFNNLNNIGLSNTRANTPPRWAWVAGASEGLGLAFASALARRGYALLLIARRGERLDSATPTLQELGAPAVRNVVLDLAAPDVADTLQRELAHAPPMLAVYNAAFAAPGPFLDTSLADHQRAVDVNVRSVLIWAHTLGRAMRINNNGALLFMSSLAGNQGAPGISAYAATKAFNTIFAEGLWGELQADGIDVVVCDAGAIRTPGLLDAADREPPGILDPEVVAERALAAIGRGPRVTPGWVNAVAARVLGRWLPRSVAIRSMAAANRSALKSANGSHTAHPNDTEANP